MREFLEYLIKEISAKPEEVKVEEKQENGIYIYQINIAEEDMGVVIGREGKTIRSLRNLAKAKAIKDNVRIQIVLEESSQKFEDGDSSDLELELENEDD